MNRVAFAALGMVVGVAWWLASRRRDAGAGVSMGDGITNAFNEGVDYMQNAAGNLSDSFGFKRVGNMSKVDRDLVNHPNVRAFLRVIRQGESSQDDAVAYRMIVGRIGPQFSSFADHPRVFGTRTSTAAGAYQITKTTWDWVRPKMGLKDFSPASQDMAALGLIAYRGALLDVLAGNLDEAIPKLVDEWTSLPGAKENNKAAGGMENAKRLFISFGGSGAVYA